MFKDQIILVTGGTGSWGHELVIQLLRQSPKRIIVFSRNELSQVAMQQKFNDPRLCFRIGDIREKETLLDECQGVDSIFHLAALKHVPICEHQPDEALKTNIIGTQNVIEAAIKNNVKNVVYVSTDKAAGPFNFYGLTKAIGEKLIVYANLQHSRTKFVCIRGGNVLGSNGSVIHVFKKQIQDDGRIGITDRRMTRFFLTLQEAIALLFKAIADSHGGEIFVMKMPACRILDLAEVIIETEANDRDIPIKETGIRPGEKIHEILFSEYEGQNAVHYDDEYFVILPTLPIPRLHEYYKSHKPAEIRQYVSNQTLMTKEEIKKMLTKGGFLSS